MTLTPEELILADLPASEIRSAMRSFPDDWASTLDYEFVDEHAEQVNQFFSRVIPQLPPAEALTLAEACQDHYLLAMAYLDAVDVAAQLLIGSIERLLSQLADILDDTWYLADGPDAGVSQETYRRFVAAAAQLRQVDLTIAPPEHT